MKKISTKICLETASKNNKFQTEKLRLSGYDLTVLAENCSMADIVFLLFSGELPSCGEDKKLLETLMVLQSLLSPRHPASRAAMNAGISKTNTEHILPIALLAIGGEQSGAAEVSQCWNFIEQHQGEDVASLVNTLVTDCADKKKHIAAGFGQSYGEVDPLATQYFKQLLAIKPQGKSMSWVSDLLVELSKQQLGILNVGVAACVFHELSFGARESIALYQFLSAPGLMAYGLEQSHKPVSAIPMLEDSDYELIE